MLKRSFDLIVSIIALALLSPVFLIIAIWIKLDSRGTVFYKQTRIGKEGREFFILKFRSMFAGSDKQGLLTIGGKDPRVTGSGYFIRRYKLDELPQLLNVLMGDMSVVGPRPEVPKYVSLYNEEQRKILSVKPGISDMASIRFSNENELLENQAEPEAFYISRIMPEKLLMNLEYVRNNNLWMDIKIIFLTLLRVIQRR